MPKARKETFQFAVDSALLGELGERLVSTVHVALAELVKNAYDADAKHVSVQVVPEKGGAPRVVVEDDGSGMTVEDVRRFWMKIGTYNKLAAPITPLYGRLKTGSKGIGRFACRRLGAHLRLTTSACAPKPNKGVQTTVVQFDWDEFIPGTDVESVECTGTTAIQELQTTGTRLEIWGGAIDEWQTRGFEYLQRQLAALASNRGAKREGFTPDPGFEVRLVAPGLTDTAIDLREAVIDASWGTVHAAVDEDGRAVCALNAKGLGGTKKFVSRPIFKRISGASMRIGVLPSRKEEARNPALLSKYVLNTLVTDWGGVQVRFNGFRMFPYGDAGDDWLRIDADRGRRVGKPEDSQLFEFAASLKRVDASRSLLNMLGMRNYFGQVEVTSKISRLTPRIDRQGFVENDVFEDLRSFARFAIDWASIHRDNYIRLKEDEEAKRARDAVRPVINLDGPKGEIVQKAAAYLRSEIKRIVTRLPPAQQKRTEKTLLATIKAIETSSAENYRQLEHLRLVASASTLTLLFAHEVRTVIGTLGATSVRLEQLASAAPKASQELRQLAAQVKETKNRFDGLVEMTGIVGSVRGSDRLDSLHLRTAAERAIKCFQLVIKGYGIEADAEGVAPDLLVGPMIEGELYTILLNLISNSVKAVIAGGAADRRIRLEAETHGRQVILRVLDTGIGLAEEFFDEVFTPFISDPSGELYDRLEERSNPEDAQIFGAGSGLGLAIARDIARARGGDVEFAPVKKPWKTCVIVRLP